VPLFEFLVCCGVCLVQLTNQLRSNTNLINDLGGHFDFVTFVDILPFYTFNISEFVYKSILFNFSGVKFVLNLFHQFK